MEEKYLFWTLHKQCRFWQYSRKVWQRTWIIIVFYYFPLLSQFAPLKLYTMPFLHLYHQQYTYHPILQSLKDCFFYPTTTCNLFRTSSVFLVSDDIFIKSLKWFFWNSIYVTRGMQCFRSWFVVHMYPSMYPVKFFSFPNCVFTKKILRVNNAFSFTNETSTRNTK